MAMTSCKGLWGGERHLCVQLRVRDDGGFVLLSKGRKRRMNIGGLLLVSAKAVSDNWDLF